jgi:hypothetical protein
VAVVRKLKVILGQTYGPFCVELCNFVHCSVRFNYVMKVGELVLARTLFFCADCNWLLQLLSKHVKIKK